MIRHLIASLAVALFSLNAYAAVDANQATRADLETVKGIGPGLSAKIVDARKTGAFKDWNDLVDRVGGIGPGNAARFSQAGLTVGGSSFDAQALPAAAEKKEAKAKKAASEKAAAADKAAEKTSDKTSDKISDKTTRTAVKPGV